MEPQAGENFQEIVLVNKVVWMMTDKKSLVRWLRKLLVALRWPLQLSVGHQRKSKRQRRKWEVRRWCEVHPFRKTDGDRRREQFGKEGKLLTAFRKRETRTFAGCGERAGDMDDVKVGTASAAWFWRDRKEQGQLCTQGGLLGGNWAPLPQTSAWEGSRGEKRNVDVKGNWGNSGTHARNFLSKITCGAWGCGWRPQAGPGDLDQPWRNSLGGYEIWLKRPESCRSVQSF